LPRRRPAPRPAEPLGVLLAVLTAVRDAGPYPDVLGRICQALTCTVPCDRATVYVWSARRRVYLPAADHGTPPEVVRDFISRGFAAGAFPGEEQLRVGRPVFAVRDRVSGALAEMLDVARLHALLVLPLSLSGGAEGTLACGMHAPPAFDASQVALLEAVAPHVAILMQNARLQSRTARLAERRTQLAAWAADILASADVAETGRKLAEAARALFGVTHAGLVLLEDGALVARRGEEAWRIPLDGPSILAEALRTRTVVVANEFARSRYAVTELARTFRPASALAAPLVDALGPLGVLSAGDLRNPYRFGAGDVEDAALLTAIAAVALRKQLLVQELRHASAAKSEFLANVSHDLRTPLNVISGYCQLLGEETFGPVTAEQADALARVLRTVRDQVTLIDDLLDLARIEQGKLACQVQRVPVVALVPRLRETMDVLLRDRPIRFEVAVGEDAVARTDAERLRQVLVNLLANAARFTREGCVRLLAAREPDAIRVSVEDTGPGMDAALAARALEPFVHGPEEHAGSGLGLAIVARLLQLLGGRVDIDSAPGRGTRVDVRLPAA
jgi:signal transduction histidine kinase